MPNINAIFPESTKIRNFLKINKSQIRIIVAQELGYSTESVAFIPNLVSRENLKLSDNLLPLEFKVDSGTRSLDRENDCAEKIKQRIINECPGATYINFGVWIITHAKNGYTENKLFVR